MGKKPVTINIDEDTDNKIRQIQARLIKSTNDNWSYSKVIQAILNEKMNSVYIEKLIDSQQK